MRKKKTNRGLRTLVVVIVLVIILAAAAFLAVGLSSLIQGNRGSGNNPAGNANATIPTGETASSSQPEPEPETLKLSFSAVGDNLVHDGLYLQANARAGGNGYDFSYCFENVSYFFNDFDVNWINQETLVNSELPAATYPQFSTPGEMGQATYAAGWRVYSLSNNHTYDMGAAGISATRSFWASMPEDLVTTGLYTDEGDEDISLQKVNGITIAYVSFTESTNGLPEPEGAEAHIIYTSEVEKMERLTRRADELADVVIVCLHWGVENSHDITEEQRSLAANVASWGGDMIIGTHPHVIQSIEMVQDASNPDRQIPVAYSLGNFISAQSQANQMVGTCLTFDMEQVVDPNGTRHPVTINNIKAHPTVTHYDSNYTNIRNYMYRDYTPELAASHGVQARYPGFSREYIEELVRTYIPEEYLVLD